MLGVPREGRTSKVQYRILKEYPSHLAREVTSPKSGRSLGEGAIDNEEDGTYETYGTDVATASPKKDKYSAFYPTI
jgi:hypothetical protein